MLHGDDDDKAGDGLGDGGGQRGGYATAAGGKRDMEERAFELAERRGAGGRGKGLGDGTYSPLVVHEIRNRAVVV